MQPFQHSLIISTYNWPGALSLCLKSVLHQTVMPGEIIVADDGSTSETKLIIEAFAKKSSVPVKHVWHEDTGFRLAQIRNKAFAQSRFDYLIQIDGDLILHPAFVADHLAIAQSNHFVSGSRMLLSPQTSDLLIANQSIAVRKYLNKNDRNTLNGLRSGILSKVLADVYKQSGKYKYYVKGCNMAFWKKDILAVNGYNESFTGWGKEDSEIAIRLINAGVRKRFLKFGGVSYHLYHKEASRHMEQANIQLMQEAIENGTTVAGNGLNKYFENPVTA